MPTDAYVPPKFVLTTLKMPDGLSRKQKLAFNIKRDKLVDKANKCIHRYFWNLGRLNMPLKGVQAFERERFVMFVEFIEEVNMEWAKQPNLNDWLEANPGRHPIIEREQLAQF